MNFFYWTLKINIQKGMRDLKQFFGAVEKKNHCFLNHYVQVGGSNNFPLNVS